MDSRLSVPTITPHVRKRHPLLFASPTNIDRGQGKRIVPMQVLNLSFPRTGTMSMQTALSILGHTCYHSSLFFTNIRDCAVWDSALDAKFFSKGTPFTRKEWDQLLGSYGAISADPPAIAFAEDLIAAYPDAKVLLVERDIDAWHESFCSTVVASLWSPWMNFVAGIDPWFVGPMRDTHKRWAVGWMGARSEREMRERARDQYREHYALVRRITPRERLLEYRLGDGWEPLCRFLGKEVPDVPFPRVNDSAALWEQSAIIARRGLRNALGVAVKSCVLCVALWIGWWVLMRGYG